jgi:hypothetical protein
VTRAVTAAPAAGRAAALLALCAALACSREPRTPAASPSPAAAMPKASPLTVPDPLPEVIAKVNGTPIPLRSARIIVDEALKGLTPTPPQRALEYHRAMERLIARELLRQEAAARGLAPDPAAVERVRKQIRSQHPDDAAYLAFLARMGLDEKAFAEELGVRNVVEKIVKQEAEKVPSAIPEEQAREYYAANRAQFETGGRPLPFEDVRGRIQEEVAIIRRQEALNALLARLRSEARIEKFL